MGHKTIELRIEGDIATLRLNRPEVMNALNSTMRYEIADAVQNLPETLRCLILTGQGRAFCSGQDLGDAQVPVDLGKVLRDEYEPMVRAIRKARVPVIDAVNGVAAGAGASLALAADVVIAAHSAVFVQAFTRIGLMPDAGGTFTLPRLIGHARAMGAMLFAEPIPATQAASWGMIWEAVPDDGFEAHVAARARMLARGPTAAFLAIRQALVASAGKDFQAQLEVEAALQGQLGESRDFYEGVAAFLEKRSPQFTGA